MCLLLYDNEDCPYLACKDIVSAIDDGVDFVFKDGKFDRSKESIKFKREFKKNLIKCLQR